MPPIGEGGMHVHKIKQLLKANTYPGRGIVLGRSEDGIKAVIAYFIMGRSENSRNRIFFETEDRIVTQAADETKLEDPSLIIYTPVRRHKQTTIVTNGDQTDTIFEYLASGSTFEAALRTCTFEPDAPNFTPRISGVVTLGDEEFSYQMSILKSEDGGKSVQRSFWEYPQPQPGVGHFIHTYSGDDTPLPPFAGEPIPVGIDGTLATFAASIWNSLHAANKVSLFVRGLSLHGEEETLVFNKYNKL